MKQEEEERLLKLELEDELIREEMNIQREEPMNIWIRQRKNQIYNDQLW